jgi:hypothetical protein
MIKGETFIREVHNVIVKKNGFGVRSNGNGVTQGAHDQGQNLLP